MADLQQADGNLNGPAEDSVVCCSMADMVQRENMWRNRVERMTVTPISRMISTLIGLMAGMSTLVFGIITYMGDNYLMIMGMYFEPAEKVLSFMILGHWVISWYVNADRISYLYDVFSILVYVIVGPILLLNDISVRSPDFYFLVAVSRFIRFIYLFYIIINSTWFDTSETNISFLIYKNVI